MQKDILPDSRTQVIRGRFLGKWGVWWINIYCASCGKPAGAVPEETTTFAFFLCDECYETYGAVAGCMIEPELVFWERVNYEMEEKYGRILTPMELQAIIDADSSPLASLMKEGATYLKGA